MQMRFSQPQTEGDGAVPTGQKASTIAPELAAIRERFRQRIRGDYAILVRYRDCSNPPAQELATIVHRLSGSAAMVGFAEIGAAASRLDEGFVDAGAHLDAMLGELLLVLEQAMSDATPADRP